MQPRMGLRMPAREAERSPFVFGRMWAWISQVPANTMSNPGKPLLHVWREFQPRHNDWIDPLRTLPGARDGLVSMPVSSGAYGGLERARTAVRTELTMWLAGRDLSALADGAFTGILEFAHRRWEVCRLELRDGHTLVDASTPLPARWVGADAEGRDCVETNLGPERAAEALGSGQGLTTARQETFYTDFLWLDSVSGKAVRVQHAIHPAEPPCMPGTDRGHLWLADPVDRNLWKATDWMPGAADTALGRDASVACCAFCGCLRRSGFERAGDVLRPVIAYVGARAAPHAWLRHVRSQPRLHIHRLPGHQPDRARPLTDSADVGVPVPVLSGLPFTGRQDAERLLLEYASLDNGDRSHPAPDDCIWLARVSLGGASAARHRMPKQTGFVTLARLCRTGSGDAPAPLVDDAEPVRYRVFHGRNSADSDREATLECRSLDEVADCLAGGVAYDLDTGRHALGNTALFNAWHNEAEPHAALGEEPAIHRLYGSL